MFKEMSYVYAVYQEKSFTKAAKKLFLSQPALSIMVKRAEQRIGLPIFDRSTTPITLTPAGRYYIEQVEKIMKIQQDTADYFHLILAHDGGQLRLGGSSFFLSYVYPPVVNRFKKKFDDLNVLLVELRGAEMIGKLLDGSVDFFIEVDDLESEHLERLVWGEEQVILAVPSAWPINEQLAKYRLTAEDIHKRRHLSDEAPPVDLTAFAELPFILLRAGNDSFRRAVEICRGAGFTPKVSMTADQVITSYCLATEGHGIAFIRDSLLFYTNLAETLYFYKLDDPLALRPIYLYHRHGPKQSPIAQAFLNFLRAGG